MRKSVNSSQDTVVSQTKKQKTGESEELRNRLARALADYDNLVKRLARERDEVYKRAAKNLLEDLLPILDNLERAQDHLNDPGLKMAIDQFKSVLAEYGLEEIRVEQQDKFDSNIHEAVESVEGGEKNTIAGVLVKGYRWKDGKVLRAAKVIVSSGEIKNENEK